MKSANKKESQPKKNYHKYLRIPKINTIFFIEQTIPNSLQKVMAQFQYITYEKTQKCDNKEENYDMIYQTSEDFGLNSNLIINKNINLLLKQLYDAYPIPNIIKTDPTSRYQKNKLDRKNSRIKKAIYQKIEFRIINGPRLHYEQVPNEQSKDTHFLVEEVRQNISIKSKFNNQFNYQNIYHPFLDNYESSAPQKSFFKRAEVYPLQNRSQFISSFEDQNQNNRYSQNYNYEENIIEEKQQYCLNDQPPNKLKSRNRYNTSILLDNNNLSAVHKPNYLENRYKKMMTQKYEKNNLDQYPQKLDSHDLEASNERKKSFDYIPLSNYVFNISLSAKKMKK